MAGSFPSTPGAKKNLGLGFLAQKQIYTKQHLPLKYASMTNDYFNLTNKLNTMLVDFYYSLHYSTFEFMILTGQKVLIHFL